ncbi:two-component system OmpR family response regulator [Methylohalomonas lacus]|uniref:Two-component system OmpR family response regulator n=1 Tax=Methylohalomonas lacus TaxID=398773 RepID=A0AAE3L0U3_9GAMM|nr:proteobacterial dedicated sortase system response regulator [Methylohalomonas lacus]MCS3903099.1 two-component system OmpR family response regulator [Methylohalomonas lacus]
MAKRIVIVEDEPAIRENYTTALKRQGYEVQAYADRPAALKGMASKLPDLVIVDIGLGDEHEGGFDLCRELRARSAALPIIFLTARDSELDTVSGLRLGADDYLTKDITLAQLLARVAALFRRIEALRGAAEQREVVTSGELHLDRSCMTADWRGQPVELTLTEFWIVYSLARLPGHVKSRDQLMQDAELFVDDATITSHVKRIRRKFIALDPAFDCIEAVYGMGYRWNSH